MKFKVDGDEIENVSILVNELYERMQELENRVLPSELAADNPNLGGNKRSTAYMDRLSLPAGPRER